jgi:ADP-heptose:LPS heptosyltransferase
MDYVGVHDRAYPELYLTEAETAEAKRRYSLPYITVCPTGKTTFCANRKEWGVDNFQVLRDLLGDYRFVQVGLASDALLDRVIDGRDLDVRQTAAAIKASLFFVGLEGGLMHLTRAVGQRAVIIYGGFIRPEISAYSENLSIYMPVDCSPCFHSDYVHEPCATMACMKMISPEMVYDRIRSEFLSHTEAEA